jgi:uncharacterized 2Fe-2S/4Fe-4S cluster protein (DUF4445 family)
MALTISINGQTTEATPGLSLFDHAERLGIPVPTSCHKQGKCRECIVEVTEGAEHLTAPAPEERHLSSPYRLSCRAHVERVSDLPSAGQVGDPGDGPFRLPYVVCHTMRRNRMRIETTGHMTRIAHEPATGHGLAIDLGTTTIVLRLYNLETGVLIADTSFENPQRFGGSDVMSRIHYDTTHPGRLLMRTLAGYLSRAIAEFPFDPRSITEVVLVGNSTMRDLFFRKSVYTIGQNPYRSITEIELVEGHRTSTALTETGRRSLLPIHPDARVWGAPILSGHVGADAAACMLAIDLAHEDRVVAVMDIGTNTELILGNRHRILAASCPAGPAFEGGAISCGMPALEGAIEDVEIADDGEFRLGVIGDLAPAGICGSGLVDLLSELLRTGRMNELGRFDGPRIDLAPGVYFTENDVSELAQAKGAHVAGLHIVCDAYGIGFDNIDVFYLAGGFGRHLKPDAARRIGLIPNLPDSKIVQIGNAAIEGASIALLACSRREELEALVRRVEHVRLETHPRFFDHFVDGCQFRPTHSLAHHA